MSLLNTLLDLGIIGLQAGQHAKIVRLQHQHGQAAAAQMIVEALREEIFKSKQAAEVILRAETANPRVAAGAMRLLEMRLTKLGVKPALFPEPGDKEYVANTLRLVGENSERMRAQLPAKDRQEVKAVAEGAIKLPDYAYYLENHENAGAYRKAKARIEALELYNNGCLSFIYFVASLIVFPSVGGMISSLFGEPDAGIGIGLVLALGSYIYLQSKAHRKEFIAAKKTVKDLEAQFDMEAYEELERELGTDYARVSQLHAKVQARIQQFFDGSDLTHSTPRSA